MADIAATNSNSHSTGLKVMAMAAMGVVYFLSYFQRVAIPGPIFNDIQNDLQAPAAAVTALSALFFYIYAGMQLLVGLAADRYGGRRTLLVGGVLMVAGSFLFPLAHSLPLLYAARAVTGLGASFIFLSFIKEVDTLWHPRHFVLFWGLIAGIGNSGGLAATAPFRWLADAVTWRHALLAVAALSAVALVAAGLTLRRLGDAPAAPPRPLWQPLLGILRNRRSRPLIILSLIVFPVFFVVQVTLGGKFLTDFCGVNARTASLILMLMIGTTAGVSMLAEPLQRLAGQRRKLVSIVGVGLGLAATVAMVWGARTQAPAGLFLVCFVLLAACTGIAPPALSTIMKEVNDPAVVSQSIAVVNCGAYVGMAVLSNFVGVVLDRYADQAVTTAAGTVYPGAAYGAIFVVLAGLMLVALVTVLFVGETGGKGRIDYNSKNS